MNAYLLGYKLQVDKAGESLAEVIAKEINQLGGEVSDEQLAEAKQHLDEAFGGISNVLFDYKDQLSTERFENALSELAKRNPLRAYRIRAHRLMVELAASQEALLTQLFVNQLCQDLEASELSEESKDAYKKAFAHVMNEERTENIDSFLNDLNSDMRWLAWSCGPVVWVRIVVRLAFSNVGPIGQDFNPDDIQRFLYRVECRQKEILAAADEQEAPSSS